MRPNIHGAVSPISQKRTSHAQFYPVLYARASKDRLRSPIAWRVIAWTIFVLAVVLIVIAVMRFNFTALPAPGRLETHVANQAKRFFIGRASRQGIPARPRDTKASVETGSTQYGLDCSVCHATDGRGQGTPGQWMYPRASDLTSKGVQSYSDQELFWIIQNGVRYTGMPAFGKVETPDHIWDLVNYVRTLPGELRSENSIRDSDSAQRRRDDPTQAYARR
jgi:mono/diheme cytochrome c family protein